VTCVATALQHQGVVLQPSFLCGAHLKFSALRVVAVVSLDLLGIYAVCPTRKHVTPKVRLLIDFVADALLGVSDAPGHCTAVQKLGKGREEVRDACSCGRCRLGTSPSAR